jgi:hypothetical protein
MNADNYETIFELGFGSFPWTRVIQPIIFLTIGLLLIPLFRSKKYYFIVGVFVASMASLFLFISLVTFVPNFVKLRTAYVSGKSLVIEGVVQDFRPAPTVGPARESFSVDGISFAYNALEDTPCFRNAPFRGGPVREGLDVRIHYYEGCIQRIEVLR